MRLRRKIGCAVGIGALVTPLLALALLNTRVGERAVTRLVEQIVTQAIPGHMTVHSLDVIEVLSPPGIVRARAIDARFFAPQGAEVIHVEHAIVEFDALALLHRDIRLRRARVNGGGVTIEPNGTGGTLIEMAFHSPSNAHSNRSRPDISLQELRVQNIQLRAPLGEERTLELRELEGVVEVTVRADDPGVVVNLQKIGGIMEQPRILGSQLHLIDATGTVRGKREEVVRLACHATVGGGAVQGTFRFQPHAEQPAQLSVRPDGLVANVATMVAMVQDAVGGKLAVDLLGPHE